MKCDELEKFDAASNADLSAGYDHRYAYDADEVDAAIAELKAENERLKKCEIWMKQHFYCEEVIACESAKNRRLKRALWLARADRAMMTLDFFTLKCRWFKDYMKVEPPKCDVKMIHKWATVQRKCRAKAEQYQ
jgi:hypothetical protein